VYARDGVVTTSDRSLKKQIAPSPLGIDFIRRLTPVMYRWKVTLKQSIRGSLLRMCVLACQTDMHGVDGKRKKTKNLLKTASKCCVMTPS